METSPHIPKRYHFPSPGFSHYWQHGHGKRLAQSMTGAFPDEAEIRTHIPWLFKTDELADRVVNEVLLQEGFGPTHAWIQQGLHDPNNPAIPESLRELIRHTLQQPDWLDTTKLENGARLCQRAGVRGLVVLRNYCLMGGYESAAINKPLIFTEALKKGAAKRTAETTEFWIAVTGEHAMQEISGKKACLMVRLMHAHARATILQRSDWHSEDWGQPLNQWDMVATNLGFSIVFLDGLRLLGMQPDADEIEGLFHFWKYIGYLLGIPETLLPENESQAIRELYSWTITQPPADDDTKALAHALMEEPLVAKHPPKNWQKRRVVQLHLAYNYFFLGRHSCEAMGLPVKGWTIYPATLRFVTRIQEKTRRISNSTLRNNVLKNRRQQERIAAYYLKGHEK